MAAHLTLGEINAAEVARVQPIERDGYNVHWSGWIPTSTSSLIVAHWLAWPTIKDDKYRPYMCVVCGARGAGWYSPGDRFDLRPHPDVPFFATPELQTEAGQARASAEIERGKQLILSWIDLLVGSWANPGEPGWRTPVQVPKMRQIILVPIDAQTGELIRDEVR